MPYKKNLKRFLNTLAHPKVLIFLLVGAGVIFLTFLTSNNALEIAISGMASVFIGISVNNFSIIDTHQADENKIQPKIAQTLKMMEITIHKVQRIQEEANGNDYIKKELTDLGQYMEIIIELIKEAGITIRT